MMRSVLFLGLFFCLSTTVFAEKKIQIDADNFLIDSKTNNVIATGNVVVRQENLKIYGPTGIYEQDKELIRMNGGIRVERLNMILTCENIIADGKKNEVQAWGNVQFTLPKIKGKSDKAVYNIQSQEIMLEGNPVAWQDDNILNGDRILINVNEGKVKTLGRAKVILSPEKLK